MRYPLGGLLLHGAHLDRSRSYVHFTGDQALGTCYRDDVEACASWSRPWIAPRVQVRSDRGFGPSGTPQAEYFGWWARTRRCDGTPGNRVWPDTPTPARRVSTRLHGRSLPAPSAPGPPHTGLPLDHLVLADDGGGYLVADVPAASAALACALASLALASSRSRTPASQMGPSGSRQHWRARRMDFPDSHRRFRPSC